MSPVETRTAPSSVWTRTLEWPLTGKVLVTSSARESGAEMRSSAAARGNAVRAWVIKELRCWVFIRPPLGCSWRSAIWNVDVGKKVPFIVEGKRLPQRSPRGRRGSGEVEMRLRFYHDLSTARRLKGTDAPVPSKLRINEMTELEGSYWALAAVFWVWLGLGRRAFRKSVTGRVLRTSFFSSQPRRAMVTP